MNNNNIHKTAIISSEVEIGEGTTIGPYSVIEGNVKIGKNCTIHSHVVIGGNTIIGDNNSIFPFASIGLAPQDLKYKGEKSQVIIGNNNVIREYTTINPGTESGGMITKIGDNCLFMISSHIAHDCIVGNNVIMANNATIAGHVTLGDFAIIGGLSAVHQFVRIGDHAMIGGMSGVEKDVIPYGTAIADRAALIGLNFIGMKRRGFSKEEISNARDVYKILFESNVNTPIKDKIEQLKVEMKDFAASMQILDFIDEDSSRPLCQPK